MSVVATPYNYRDGAILLITHTDCVCSVNSLKCLNFNVLHSFIAHIPTYIHTCMYVRTYMEGGIYLYMYIIICRAARSNCEVVVGLD